MNTVMNQVAEKTSNEEMASPSTGQLTTQGEEKMETTLERTRQAAGGIKNARGMTLVEIMIVITIMASVMGVVGFFVFGALDTANERTAQIEIQQLEQMVNAYYLSTSPNRIPNSLEELTEGPSPLTQKVPTDPWGNDYVFIRHNNREYEIFSTGADGVEGTDLDVRVGD